jgi:L-lactate dehydrogenase complex protein LldG
MTDQRAAILGRLSKTLGHTGSAVADAVTQRLETRPRGPQPQWPETLRERFLAKLARVSGTHVEIGARTEIAHAVAAYLEAQQLPSRLAAAPHPLLAGVEWPAAFQVARRHAQGDDRVGLAVAFCGIAESGSLMLLSGPDSPTTLNFLPDDFLCLLPAGRIVPRMEDAWDLLRSERGTLPRSTNFISGPSRTADVEQTLQLGAHGPRRLHVLLLDEAPD